MSEVFLRALSGQIREDAEAYPGLDGALNQFYSTGVEAWPKLNLSREEFITSLVDAVVSSPPKKGIVQWLEHVHAKDFFLAQACRLGRVGSLECFEKAYKKDFERLIRKYQGPDLLAEDLLQQLREKLFVSTSKRKAKISSYSGQGLLQNWFRVTSARLCIDMLRSVNRRQGKELLGNNEQILNIPDSLQNLELDFLKREYQGQFKEAFAVAVDVLSPHERNLLRQHLIHQLTVEQLGKLYGVHASTISRRVTKARERLLKETREAFMQRLKISNRDFDSIMVIIRSRLDLSMPRLLQSTITESND